MRPRCDPIHLPCSERRLQLHMYIVVANGACHCRPKLVLGLKKPYKAALERLANPGVAKPLVAACSVDEDAQRMEDALLSMEPPVGSFFQPSKSHPQAPVHAHCLEHSSPLRWPPPRPLPDSFP